MQRRLFKFGGRLFGVGCCRSLVAGKKDGFSISKGDNGHPAGPDRGESTRHFNDDRLALEAG